MVLDRLLDPHNTAAILRTAEGLGVARAHVVAHRAGDAIAHRRVTQDAHKWLEVEPRASGAGAVEALRSSGFEVWAGHLTPDARLYTELPADRAVALLFGNEHEGPAPETLAACTGTFRIPMAGFTQSFNVSVAAAIALAHLTAARRRYLRQPGDLSEEARVLLRNAPLKQRHLHGGIDAGDRFVDAAQMIGMERDHAAARCQEQQGTPPRRLQLVVRDVDALTRQIGEDGREVGYLAAVEALENPVDRVQLHRSIIACARRTISRPSSVPPTTSETVWSPATTSAAGTSTTHAAAA